jgi:hypothetical protein
MSQDESLRLVAEVQDKFTGPLGNLKRKIADLAAAGAGNNDVLEKSFSKVTGGIRATEQAAASGLNPALRTIGVTSLTAAGAIAGIRGASAVVRMLRGGGGIYVRGGGTDAGASGSVPATWVRAGSISAAARRTPGVRAGRRRTRRSGCGGRTGWACRTMRLASERQGLRRRRLGKAFGRSGPGPSRVLPMARASRPTSSAGSRKRTGGARA